MPSLVSTMVASPAVFATERVNAKIKPSIMMIDNVLGAQDAIISIQDRFTPAVSNGVPIPGVTTVSRLSINVSMAACVSIRDELKDVKVLGQLEAIIVTPDAACIVSMGWDFE